MTENVTVYLNEYQPYPWDVKSVCLDFALFDDHVLVTNTMILQRTHEGALHLFGDELDVVSLHCDDKLMDVEDYCFDGDDLHILRCPDTCTLKIVTRLQPQDNTKLSGLYRSHDLFCTQCEAEGFRRITLFPDRPDVLTLYTTRISADQKRYPVLLSNGHCIDAGVEEDGRHWVLWQDPFKKPSYLFALVAGHLACVEDTYVTLSGRHVSLRIYVEAGLQDQCAHAMTSLQHAMRWDEEVYGLEYDLDLFMIVAVSDFNMGAMENKGLNVFNTKYILATPAHATDIDYAGIEGVVAHEYFHNWTGNRVTCRDWFQLSLKEGLTVFRDQEFSRDMNSRDVARILDVKVLRQHQYPEDAGRMAHPVRPSSYQEINNFYTATIYNKGAEVIRMLETLVTKQGFRQGMDLYFARHDGQAVTCDDFVAAISDANGIDLTQFKRWYTQAGTPHVVATLLENNGQFTLKCSQSCPQTPDQETKKPFHIPIKIALFDDKGERISLDQDVLELREEEQSFDLGCFTTRPIVSLLRDFSAPILLTYDQNHAERLSLLKHETDGFSAWEAAQHLAMQQMIQAYETPHDTFIFPKTLLDAYQQILLDDTRDSALRAELLTPPGFEDLLNVLTLVDVTRVEKVRLEFLRHMGQGLWDTAYMMYERLWQQEDHAMHGEAYGRRALRHVCLMLLMHADEASALKLCQRQYAEAQTMTDQGAGLFWLSQSMDERVRLTALETFEKKWQHDELVMDKWFSVQARRPHPQTLQRVQELMTHPAFSLTNPNKVRALIGAFTQSNPLIFHAADGSGYAFLRTCLEKLDPINSQISARLAAPLTQWQRFDAPRQNMMREHLDILSARTLSRDLREVVEKSQMK